MATKKLGDQEKLIFGFDWADWLTNEGATIASSIWVIPTELTEVSSQVLGSITTTILELNTGTVGEAYTITNIITTDVGSGSQEAERSMTIAVVETKYR